MAWLSAGEGRWPLKATVGACERTLIRTAEAKDTA
jgi:hypothetical protein